MAYFQLITQYPLGTAKGGCYLCGEGGTVEGPKVDTGIVIDFEGGLVVCHACILQIAQLCGLVEQHYVDEATASMHELQRVADEATVERDEARQLVHLLRRVDERNPGGNSLLSEADHKEPAGPAREPADQRASHIPADENVPARAKAKPRAKAVA